MVNARALRRGQLVVLVGVSETPVERIRGPRFLSVQAIDRLCTNFINRHGWKPKPTGRQQGQKRRVLHAAERHRERAPSLPGALPGQDRPLQLR